jgi:hypothetical protein
MPLSYNEFANATASQKLVLGWIGAAQRLMVWSVHAGSVYLKDVPEFVTGLVQDNTSLTKVANVAAINGAGKWFFDVTAKRLYCWPLSSSEPDTVFLRADYRIFVANAPVILPWDLDAGEEVEYLPILQENSEFPYEIDPEQFGIALEGQGEIALENSDGYFDSRFERYWWENKDATLWSWSPSIALSEKKKLYRGILSGKAFSERAVRFGLKDFIAKLNNNIVLQPFDGTEGNVQPSIIGSVKRRIYGRVAGLRVVGLDHVLDGFEITGTVAANAGSVNLVGTGTAFLDELSPDDQLTFGESTYRVKEVTDNLNLVISSPLEENLNAAQLRSKPKKPWRKRNRSWLIAGHALKKISSTIASVTSLNRIELVDALEFSSGDQVLVGASKSTIRSKSGNLLVLEQNLSSLPSIGTVVSRYPVQAANWGTKDLVFIRDFTVDNDPAGAILEVDELAEFNITRPAVATGSFTFTNGSRLVTATGSQFLAELGARDWIRPALGTWYEILTVLDDGQLMLRIPFAQATATTSAERKVLEVLADDSVLTVDCFGKTVDGDEDGEWIKTGPQAVKDLLGEAGLSEDLDEDSFTTASEEAEQLISLKLPLEYAGKRVPSIKDAVDLVNQTVMGSVHFNSDFEVEYSVLNSKKPPELTEIQDHDIISWEVQSRTNHIVREFICRYRHLDADRYTGEESFSYQSRVNEVADKLSDAKGTRVLDVFLYDEEYAQFTAQRYALYNESSSSRIILATHLNLSTRQLSDKIYVNLDRLFYRLGSQSSRRKIGMVVKISKTGLRTTLEIEDLSGIWNKVCNVAPTGAPVHASASEDERVRHGYLTDENGIINDNDWTYRTNLIG